MSRLTVEDIVKLAWAAGGRPEPDELSREDILKYANAEYQDMMVNHSLPEFGGIVDITTSNGVVEYGLDRDDIAYLQMGRIPALGQRVRPIGGERWMKLNAGTTQYGPPIYYIFARNETFDPPWTVSFYPIPNGVYAVEILAGLRPDELLLDGNVQFLQSRAEWDMILVDRLAIRCLLAMEKYEQAIAFGKMVGLGDRQKRLLEKQKEKTWPRSRPRSAIREALG